jgi:flagellar motor switch protein FliG
MDFNSNNNNGGIYINGKKQVIELLQFLSESERKKLLDNIKNRNAMMARELSEQSLCFRDIFQLDDHITRKVLQNINPSIIGLALYLSPLNVQRKALSLMDRAEAEQAFEIMNKNLSHKKSECVKAQNKILQIAIQLSRRNMITL